MGNEIQTQTMTVTAEIASHWLTRNHQNRKINRDRVKRYAQEMLCGKWMNHHQGIAFYDDGTLADGQHRLAAIELSGVPVDMVVARGLSRDAGLMIDGHQQRKSYQSVKISGLADWIGKEEISVIKAMVAITSSSRGAASMSLLECINYGDNHKDAVMFSVEHLSPRRRGITTAPVRAAVSSAYYYEDAERLKTFCEVMISGMVFKAADKSAIMLREHLLGSVKSSGGKNRDDACKRSMRAIKAFCEFQEISKLYQPQEYIYKPKQMGEHE